MTHTEIARIGGREVRPGPAGQDGDNDRADEEAQLRPSAIL